MTPFVSELSTDNAIALVFNESNKPYLYTLHYENKVSALSVTYLSLFIIHILMHGTEEKLLHVVSDNKTIFINV